MESRYWQGIFARRIRRRNALRAAALGSGGLVAASVVGCGDDDDDDDEESQGTALPAGSPAAGEPVRGGDLKVAAYLEGPLHFDPFTSLDKRVQQYAMYVYSPLLAFRYGPDVPPGAFEVGAHLAESWENPDATTYTFRLRSGVKFHNKPPVSGRELVAEDVVYSLQRRMDPQNPHYGSMFNVVESVSAPDATTVQIRMKQPFAPTLNYLATMHGTVVAPEVAETGSLESPDTAIGTGPWMLEEFEPKVRSRYVRHPEYFLAPLPYLDSVEDVVINPTALVGAIRSGQVQIASTTSYQAARQAEGTDVVILQQLPQTLIRTILTMRTDKQPYDDVRVRRAISMAMDREGMSEALFEGRAYLNPPLPLGFGDLAVPIEELGEGSKYYQRDVEAARALMEEAGLGSGFDTKITSVNVLPQELKDQLNVVAANLGDIDIRSTIDFQDYAVFAGQVLRGDMDAMGFTSSGGRPDPDSLLYGVYHTGETQNYSHVSDPELDKMLEAQRAELNPDARAEILADIQRYLASQQYIIYLPTAFGYDIVGERIQGYGSGEDASLKGALGDPFMEGIVWANLWFKA